MVKEHSKKNLKNKLDSISLPKSLDDEDKLEPESQFYKSINQKDKTNLQGVSLPKSSLDTSINIEAELPPLDSIDLNKKWYDNNAKVYDSSNYFSGSAIDSINVESDYLSGSAIDGINIESDYLSGSIHKGLGTQNYVVDKPFISDKNRASIKDKREPPKDEFPNLSDEEKKDLDEMLEYLTDVSLSYNSLFSLFQDWQSPKTKGSKKFLFTITFILSFGFFSGLNLLDLGLFGIETSEINSWGLIITLLFVVIFSSSYYFFHYKRDKQVNSARLKTIRGELQECLKYAEKIGFYVVKSNKADAEDLIRKRVKRETLLSEDSPLNVYNSINFYLGELRKPEYSTQILSKLENIGTSFLICTSLIFILHSAYQINIGTIDNVILIYILSVCLFVMFFDQFTR